MLYPDKALPSFLEKNLIPQSLINDSPLLQSELKSGRKEIIEQDIDGQVHFSGAFTNVADLRRSIERAGDISKGNELEWCMLFEAVFKHQEFTGRSSTMYKYEGLGCIYWHMVSKLLLAVSEFVDDARQVGAEESVLERLVAHFYNIRGGLGLYKSPTEYGA
ncbi:unnamed protein product, partial [marine sediment metagenome]